MVIKVIKGFGGTEYIYNIILNNYLILYYKKRERAKSA